MFRYVAFAWNTNDASQEAAMMLLRARLHMSASAHGAPRWRSTFALPGLEVFCAGARRMSADAHPFGDSGVILGAIFEACDSGSYREVRRKIFSPTQAHREIAAGLAGLVRNTWGRYVAIARDTLAGKTYVLRDPMGELPCFSTSFRGVSIYFSCTEDCARLGLLKFSINWDYIAARVAYGFLLPHVGTAIREIVEVKPGELVEIREHGTSTRRLWNPFQIAQTDIVDDFESAVAQLRSIGKACVHAWAGCYGAIIHHLSGGLDSSIVLGCLQDAPSSTKVTCLNYYTHAVDTDERVYARAMAARSRCTLIEKERSAALDLRKMPKMARSPSPTYYLGSLGNRSEVSLAHELAAEAFFDGGGGDQLFHRYPQTLAAADFLLANGLTRRFITVIADSARIEHLSVWSIASDAIRQAILPRSSEQVASAPTYRKLVSTVLFAQHELRQYAGCDNREQMSGGPPGKANQIRTLSIPSEFYDPYGAEDDPERVHPLRSQPLVEICLRIPTYTLITGGWDRAVARRAFQAELTRETHMRRTKGGADSYAQEVLTRNLDVAREMLMDGQLAKSGLLNREAIEEELSGGPSRIRAGRTEIFDHLGTESWIQAWTAAEPRFRLNDAKNDIATTGTAALA